MYLNPLWCLLVCISFGFFFPFCCSLVQMLQERLRWLLQYTMSALETWNQVCSLTVLFLTQYLYFVLGWFNFRGWGVQTNGSAASMPSLMWPRAIVMHRPSWPLPDSFGHWSLLYRFSFQQTKVGPTTLPSFWCSQRSQISLFFSTRKIGHFQEKSRAN